jgi:3,5-epimerase/4-reductase
MHFLIYGGNGWIGQQLQHELLRHNHILSISPFRLDDTSRVMEELKLLKPDRVVCLVGRTHGPGFGTIDYLEQPGKLVENVRDNLYAPVSLALLCRDLGIHMTYLGTGCIFEYDAEHPMEGWCSGKGSETGFKEEDLPNFFGSSYSVVKGFTDRLMHLLEGQEGHEGQGVLNVRIRMPIVGQVHPRNFITKITQYAKVCSVPNSMTVLPTLLPLLVQMMERKEVGTINLTNPGVITHDEILTMYRELVDPAFSWELFTIEEQNAVLASRRSNNQLDTSRLERMFPEVPGIREAIRGALMQMVHHH